VTVDEQNVDHFIAERSDDGNNYYSVGQLPARNTSGKQFYSPLITADQSYCLLPIRSVDIDGRQKLSRIVAILVAETANNLVLLTNPVHDHLTMVASEGLKWFFQL